MRTPTDRDAGGSAGQPLWRNAARVLVGTLASRIFGMARLAVMAAVFPKGVTDAFFVAFTIPNSLRVLLGEGAIGGAVVPVLSQVHQHDGDAAARRYVGNIAGALTLLTTLTTVCGIALAPMLVALYAPGYDPSRHALTTLLTRWTFPYIVVVALAALATGILNWAGRFAVPAAAPAALNICMIIGALSLPQALFRAGYEPALGLAIGALTGGVLQLGLQLPFLRRKAYIRWSWPAFSDPALKKTFKLMAPLLVGLGVYQLNVLLARAFASTLADGAQSYLTYAQHVAEIPQGMFAFAVSSASLPALSKLVANDQRDEAKRTFRDAVRLSLFFSFPAAVALALFSTPTIAVFFGRGHFAAESISATSNVLFLMALGIWSVATVRTTVPMFSALRDTRTPVIASAVNLLVFASVSSLFLARFSYLAIAAAFSLASIAQLASLLFFLRRKVGPLGLRSVAGAALRMVFATVPMGLVLLFARSLAPWQDGARWHNVASYGAVTVVSALVYLAASAVLCPEEFLALRRVFRRRTAG